MRRPFRPTLARRSLISNRTPSVLTGAQRLAASGLPKNPDAAQPCARQSMDNDNHDRLNRDFSAFTPQRRLAITARFDYQRRSVRANCVVNAEGLFALIQKADHETSRSIVAMCLLDGALTSHPVATMSTARRKMQERGMQDDQSSANAVLSLFYYC